MSEPVSALGGASISGIVEVADAGPVGMITIRGDLSDVAVRNALAGCLISALPATRQVMESGTDRLLWMSPDELLLLCPQDEVAARTGALSDALKDQHHMVIDVSDARAVFKLTGAEGALRETFAKLAPADLRAASLPVGEVRRTRLAQVPAAFWFASDSEAHLICFRSVADYVFGLLTHAATPGSEIAFFD